MPEVESNSSSGSSNAVELTTGVKAKLNFADAEAFEDARKSLYELAFSILRSELEAHRAVRRTLVNWLYADRKNVENPKSWLSQNCLHQSLEIFRWTHPNEDGDLNGRLGAAIDRIGNEAEPHAPSGNRLSRFVRSLLAELSKGFALCGATMHPVVVFQANQFWSEEYGTNADQNSAKEGRIE